MATQAYIAVKGQRQGQFKSENTLANRKDRWIPILSFEMDVQAPHDSATGAASGKRQFNPVTIVKKWGAASPQGLSACATNEDLPEVVIEFTKTNVNGAEYVFQRITLTDATIVEVKRFTHAQDGTLLLRPGEQDALELDRWSFVFRKIEVADNDGKTSFTDNWSATV